MLEQTTASTTFNSRVSRWPWVSCFILGSFFSTCSERGPHDCGTL